MRTDKGPHQSPRVCNPWASGCAFHRRERGGRGALLNDRRCRCRICARSQTHPDEPIFSILPLESSAAIECCPGFNARSVGVGHHCHRRLCDLSVLRGNRRAPSYQSEWRKARTHRKASTRLAGPAMRQPVLSIRSVSSFTNERDGSASLSAAGCARNTI